jgi:fatty acid desaturase
VRPAERHALEAIARALETTDPRLARELSAEQSVPDPSTRRRNRDVWAGRLILIALWVLGLSFGACLLGLGLAHHVELTTVVGAAASAAVVTLGAVLLCHRRHQV